MGGFAGGGGGGGAAVAGGGDSGTFTDSGSGLESRSGNASDSCQSHSCRGETHHDGSPPASPAHDHRKGAPAAPPPPRAREVSRDAGAGDAGDDGWEQFPRRSARRDAKKRKHAGPRACEFRGVKSWGGWWWASYGSSVRSYERKLDAARAYDMMARGAGAPHPNPNLPLDAAQRAFEAAELRGAAADEPRRAKKPRLR